MRPQHDAAENYSGKGPDVDRSGMVKRRPFILGDGDAQVVVPDGVIGEIIVIVINTKRHRTVR